MCQIAAPSTVFLAGPLQAPGGWLLVAGFLAFVLWVVPYNYRVYLRQNPSARFRRVGLALLVGALLLLWTSMVLLTLVVLPSREALSAWFDSQHATLFASRCPFTDTAYTALFNTDDRQLNGPIATWTFVAFAFMFAGFGVELMWFYWRARRPRAEPARQ